MLIANNVDAPSLNRPALVLQALIDALNFDWQYSMLQLCNCGQAQAQKDHHPRVQSAGA
jgi:hypothetical protein